MDAEYRLTAMKIERNVLQVELSDEVLRESDRYQELQQQIQHFEGKDNSEERWEPIEG